MAEAKAGQTAARAKLKLLLGLLVVAIGVTVGGFLFQLYVGDEQAAGFFAIFGVFIILGVFKLVFRA